jgi:hypothetical protein
MPWRMVLQPNGKYARFSSVVDGFTHTDLTRSEAIELCREYPGMGQEESELTVERADGEPGRFAEALKDIDMRYGHKERLKIEASLKS